MFWKALAIVTLLVALAGIPVAFFHGIGWLMMAVGAYLFYLVSDRALKFESQSEVKKIAENLKNAGKYAQVPGEASPAEYDLSQRDLEKLGFRLVENIRINSAKNAVIRLMRSRDNAIWAVIEKNRSGRVFCTFYAFFFDMTAIVISNHARKQSRFKIVPKRLIQQNFDEMAIPELYHEMDSKFMDHCLSFPESFSKPCLQPQSATDFIRLLNELHLRQRLAQKSIPLIRAELHKWGIGDPEAEKLLELQRINANEYTDYLPTAPALKLVPTTENARSHLGGLPDLPVDIKWPETPDGQAMNFVGQIYCTEIPKMKKIPPLPRNGMLSFFYAEEDERGYFGLEPGDDCGWRVLFTESTIPMKHREAPSGLVVYKEFPVSFERMEVQAGYGYQGHQMFGFPAYVQSEFMEADCAKMTTPKFASKPEDWLLLLQVNTDQVNSNLQWGDMGTLFFWIRKEDLANRRFDRVWMIMECH